MRTDLWEWSKKSPVIQRTLNPSMAKFIILQQQALTHDGIGSYYTPK